MTNVERLGSQFSIPIEPDTDGYLGRECPIDTCLGYFKITPGTGIQGPTPCYCPYCGHVGEHNTFFTQEQIDYAHSIVLRQVTDAIHQDLKALEFDHRPQSLFGIGISMKVTRSSPHPIRYYREKDLETHVVCDSCTLRYAIYGVFGWCPDCGRHNSKQILSKNLELANKELKLATTAEAELAEYLLADALENVVSAFDGFGREICLRKSADIRFQNIVTARRKVQEIFHFDFAEKLSADEWVTICRIFQKRHLLAHKMGVVDEEYISKAQDPAAVVGRRIRISPQEVTLAISLVDTAAERLFAGIL